MEISEHQVRVYRVLTRGEWVSTAELADLAEVAPRTARLHAQGLVKAGIAERRTVFPGYRYRATGTGDAAYLEQLKEACRIFK